MKERADSRERQSQREKARVPSTRAMRFGGHHNGAQENECGTEDADREMIHQTSMRANAVVSGSGTTGFQETRWPLPAVRLTTQLDHDGRVDSILATERDLATPSPTAAVRYRSEERRSEPTQTEHWTDDQRKQPRPTRHSLAAKRSEGTPDGA
jgi:hypothetical protein